MNSSKLRVGVVFGSRSCEYEVSLNSAASVIANLDTQKYEVLPLAITREGKWLFGVHPEELLAVVDSSSQQKRLEQGRAVTLVGDPQTCYLMSVEDGQQKRKESLDVIFPVIHGPYGEDGTIQGLLEMARIPYVGCGILGSALGMDKEKTKMIFRAAGLPIIDYLMYQRKEWKCSSQTVLSTVEQQIGYPCIVKPANMGSSFGISKATEREALAQAIMLALQYDRKVLIEHCFHVRELSCAVLGNDEPVASCVGEYIAQQETVLDYAAKYRYPSHAVPADIAQQLIEEIRQKSLQAFHVLDLSGLARVDFFLDQATQKLSINEVNTLPGCSATSMYSELWMASGMSYSQVLDRLIELALERHEDQQRNRTS